MFKVVLLVVSVSVVWSVAHATYILNDDIGFEILSSTRLNEHHRPILHSNLPIHFEDHSHGISIPHLVTQEIQYINQPIHHLHNIREFGFNIPHIQHGSVKHYNHYPKSEQNSQSHQINQQKLEIKAPNVGYSIPQQNNQPLYQNSQNERHFSDLIFKHGFNFGNDYNHNTGKIQSHQQNNQNIDAGKTDQARTYDVNQQKVVDIDFPKIVEQKIEQKANSEDYEKQEEKGHPPDYNGEHDKKSHTPYQTTDQNSKINYNESNYDFQHNENFHPSIYSQIPLIPEHYIKLHESNVDSYSELPRNLGQISPIYRDIDIIKYQSGLNSHEGTKIHSHTPILISDNIQTNLGNQGEYLIELKNHDGFSNLDGYAPYYFLSNNGSQSDLDNFSKYPNQETYNSNSNLEQKSVTEEYKSDEEKTDAHNIGDNLSEYKGIGSINVPENHNNGKVAIPYQSEQKSLEVGYKEQIAEKADSYGTISGNEKKYEEQKTLDIHKYSETSSKGSEYGLEQKTVEVKSRSPNVDYASDGNDGKGSEADTQQKSVDVDFKSGSNKYDYKQEGNSGSDYAKLGNIGDSTYPEVHSKKSDQKLEQKYVETETYKGLKAFFKSSDGAKDTISSSHKDYSEDIRSAISDLKKDIDSKISNYETPIYKPSVNHGNTNGGSSTTYFNSHHPQTTKNSFNYGKRSDSFPYSNSGNHNKHAFSGNTYTGHGVGFPKYPNSFGSIFNHNHPVSSFANSHGGSSSLDYNKPYASHKPSTTGNHGYSQHKSSYSGIRKSPTHSGFSGPASVSSIPIHHQGSSRGISSPLQHRKSEPYSNQKFVKITYEYPHHSLSKDEPIYASSKKPSSDYKNTFANSNIHHPFKYLQSSHSEHPVLKSHSHSSANSNSYTPQKNENEYKKVYEAPTASHSSYPDKDIKEQSTDDADYLKGIGGIEYPGIGEKSSSVVPKYESKQYSEPHVKKQTMTEQKSYENDESLPTYSESSNINKPSENEYKGIGEIGTIPSEKSEIVGGRHPIKRPVKSPSVKTKSVPSRAKGKSDEKTEQKYLPITATLSDNKPDSKQYGDSIKTKAPEKTEQQELTYEALLGGHGSPNIATGTSGYGFNPPAPSRGSSYPHGSEENDHEHPPMPYEFHFDIQDDEHGSEQYRREKMDDNGYLTGSYGFKDKEGIFREVEYEASKDGFKVHSIKTNEPGTDNQDPADVHIEVQKHQ